MSVFDDHIATAGVPQSVTNRLPSEILAHIFSIVAANEPAWSPDLYTRRRPHPTTPETPPAAEEVPHIGWIKVTHVCRHWRQTALAYPTLWERIPFTLGLQWTEEVIARSKGAPIVLDFTRERSFVHLPKELSLAKYLSEHLPRTRRLYVNSTFPATPNEISLLTAPAPCLEVFNWTCFMKIDDDNYDVDIAPDTLRPPPSLFADYAPHLRSLTLRRPNTVPWDSPILNNLQHLCVDAYHHFQFPSWNQLLTALAKMPRVGSLVLRACLPFDEPPAYEGPVAEFPHLAHIEISGSLLRCAALMQRIRTPVDCVHVDLSVMDDVAGDRGRIDAAVRTLLANFIASDHRPAPFRTAHFFIIEKSLSVGGWRSAIATPDDVDFLIKPGHHTIPPGFAFRIKSKKGDVRYLRDSLCEILPIDDIQVLSVIGEKSYWRVHTWSSALQRCRQLQHILIGDRFAATGLVAALSESLIECEPVARTFRGVVSNPSSAWPPLIARLEARPRPSPPESILFPCLISVEFWTRASRIVDEGSEDMMPALTRAREQEGNPLTLVCLPGNTIRHTRQERLSDRGDEGWSRYGYL